jgi:dolichol-phosphate mannosyltransferase
MSKAGILVSVFSFNEGEKLKKLIERFPADREYDLLFIDDGSNDGSYEFLERNRFNVIRHERNIGIGYGIREAIRYGRDHGYKIMVVMAANGKMQPEQIHRLTTPILKEGYDYTQGSRYLFGGESPHLPLFRKITIKIFTGIVNFFVGFKGTDITCGFRAYRLSLFDDRRFRLEQSWLDKYEMEYYIHYHVLKGGYRIKEVPVSMVYPAQSSDYSKIKPFTGWWSMIRPWVFLILGIKR